MGQLSGLKGTNGDAIDCVFIKSGSQLRKVLRDGFAATAAGSNGAINIWYDADGDIRCEAMRYCVTIEERTFKFVKDAAKWVNEQLIKIQ